MTKNWLVFHFLENIFYLTNKGEKKRNYLASNDNEYFY